MTTRATTFNPRVHGYKFVNHVDLVPLSPQLDLVGFCGGITWSALDFFYHPDLVLPGYRSQDLPNQALAPGWQSAPDDPVLWDYVYGRQNDSAIANGGRFVALITSTPDVNAEFALLKARIDVGQPVPIGLPTKTGWVGNSHQVIAVGYQESGAVRDILAYDPNWGDHMMVMRVASNDNVVSYFAKLAAGGAWETDGNYVSDWKGFFCTAGYQARTPPSGLQDLVVSSPLEAPASVETTQSCKVRVTVRNLGEFASALYAVRLLVDGSILQQAAVVPGGVLNLFDTFTAEFDLSLSAVGWHQLEAVFQRDDNEPSRSFQTRAVRKLLVTQGYPVHSWAELNSAPPGPLASPILGRLISGPTLLNPNAPYRYKVDAWQLRARVTIQDDYGGGTFQDPTSKVEWELEGGHAFTDRSEFVSGRQADLIAKYAPVAGKDHVRLDVDLFDANGTAYRATRTVQCSGEVTIRRVVPRVVVPRLDIPRGGGFGVIEPVDPIDPIDPRIGTGPTIPFEPVPSWRMIDTGMPSSTVRLPSPQPRRPR